MSVQMEVWGDYACWSRPELKTERYSYDVPTPSGARGMLESVYWHPGLRWHIDKVYVMNPIRFTNLRRNEVKSKILASAILSEANGKAGFVYRPQRGYPAAGDDDAPRCALRHRGAF